MFPLLDLAIGIILFALACVLSLLLGRFVGRRLHLPVWLRMIVFVLAIFLTITPLWALPENLLGVALGVYWRPIIEVMVRLFFFGLGIGQIYKSSKVQLQPAENVISDAGSEDENENEEERGNGDEDEVI